MTNAIWFLYVVISTVSLILLLEKCIRKRTTKLNAIQKAFIALPAVFLLGNMVTFVIFNSKNPYEDTDPIGNGLLLLGFVAFIVLPVIVASPLKAFWKYIPVTWGIYITWIFFVYFPHMLFCGVPLQD